MTSFKSVSLAALILALAVAFVSSLSIDNSENLYVPNALNNLILGQREYGDQIFYQENITETLHRAGKKLTQYRDIKAPCNYYITQIVCLDKSIDGSGAEPRVTEGGPKQFYVNLKFKSQIGNGIYFKIEVYGKPIGIEHL